MRGKGFERIFTSKKLRTNRSDWQNIKRKSVGGKNVKPNVFLAGKHRFKTRT